MNQRLVKKVIAITGGCGDLGGATARRLAKEGARPVLLDLLDEAAGSQRTAEVNAQLYLRCDQTDRPSVDAALTRVASELGRLDVVIANAAIVRIAPFLQLESVDWERQLSVNLTGCFHIAQSAARIMREQAPDAAGVRGKILFTSSWVALHPLPGSSGYIASKAGLEGLARSAAQELAYYGIRVNCLAPGLVYAGLTKELVDRDAKLKAMMEQTVPLLAMGTAEQVADAYAFLCSSDSDYMTGQVLTVDGGCSISRHDPE